MNSSRRARRDNQSRPEVWLVIAKDRMIAAFLNEFSKDWEEPMPTATTTASPDRSTRRKALRACAKALRLAANYRLPTPLQRKLRKTLDDPERTSPAEHQQLLILVEVAQERSLQKVKAPVALQQLLQAFPELEG